MNDRANYDLQMLQEFGGEFICGVDEVGRGPLAGPVMAASVILKPSAEELAIKDSKRVSEAKRRRIFDEILLNHSWCHCIAMTDAQSIDDNNIFECSRWVMIDTLAELKPWDLGDDPSIIAMVDGGAIWDDTIHNPYVEDEEIDCIFRSGGDDLSQAVGAASIIAKVTRDAMMIDLANQFPEYGFESHKGYGTPGHFRAIREYGILDGIHRISFLKKFLEANPHVRVRDGRRSRFSISGENPVAQGSVGSHRGYVLGGSRID